MSVSLDNRVSPVKRIIILGHTGFAGSSIKPFLEKSYPGIEVVGLSSRDVDLSSPEGIGKLEQHLGMDAAVIMCSGIKSNYGDNIDTYSKNVAMAESVCRALAARPVRRLIFFSSIAVYGVFKNDTSITESTETMPDTYYGLSKLDSERLLTLTFSKLPQSSLVILRTPTIYGPGERIIAPTPSGFLTAALDGAPVTIWGDGSELREFLYIDDLTAAVAMLVRSEFSGVLNLSSGKARPYADALGIISGLLAKAGRRLEVIHKERTKEKVSKAYDSGLARKTLPTLKMTTLEEGLEKIMKSPYSFRKACLMCRSVSVRKMIDLGKQPVSNRFLESQDSKESGFDLSVGQCRSCGLVQLTDTMPWKELVPRHSWITYAEPEAHLPGIAKMIASLPGISPKSRVLGTSFKDSSLLKILQENGISDTRLISFGDVASEGELGVETIQELLTREKAGSIARSEGTFDFIIARHIAEHAYDLEAFMGALKQMLSPRGYLLLEVPDCARALDTLNYPIIWEEHICYFTPATFRQLFSESGLEVMSFSMAPYALEDSLIAIGRKSSPMQKKDVNGMKEILAGETARAERFAAEFANARRQWRSRLQCEKGADGKVALLGAGHFACGFISYLGLGDLISFVADDNPNKKGLFMPGSGTPILGSESLLERQVKLCLMSVNPRSEEAVIRKNGQFIAGGGRMFSIFSESSHSLPAEMSPELQQQSPEVFVDSAAIPRAGSLEAGFVRQKALASSRRRARICFHKNSSELIHEMLIGLASDCYIRPHRHANKTESFHMVEGELDVVIFDVSGKVTEVIRLGGKGSSLERKFYYRAPPGLFHSVIVRSSCAIFHETTNGPFDKSQTEYPNWAPEEGGDAQKIGEFISSVERQASALANHGEANGGRT